MFGIGSCVYVEFVLWRVLFVFVVVGIVCGRVVYGYCICCVVDVICG